MDKPNEILNRQRRTSTNLRLVIIYVSIMCIKNTLCPTFIFICLKELNIKHFQKLPLRYITFCYSRATMKTLKKPTSNKKHIMTGKLSYIMSFT